MEQNQTNQRRSINEKPKKQISIFHLIIWIFVMDDQINKLDKTHKKILQHLYGNDKNVFNYICRNTIQLKDSLDFICNHKQLKCLIKIVTNQKMSLTTLNLIKNYQIVIQFYVYRPHEDYQDIEGKNLMKVMESPKFRSIVKNLNQIIIKASSEVHNFTKSYRIFHNAQLLIGDYQNVVNTYRFRLMACINIKVTDFKEFFEKFVGHARDQFIQFKNLTKQTNFKLSTLVQKLNEYKQKAESQCKYLLQCAIHDKKRQNKQKQISIENINLQQLQLNPQSNITNQRYFSKQKRQQRQLTFSNLMIKYYQQQGFLYQLINNYLRSIKNENVSWQNMAIPFSHVYKSIKYLYNRKLQEQIKLKEKNNLNMNDYTKDTFVVWRVGFIRKSQIQLFLKNKDSKMFIQFYSFVSTSLDLKLIVDQMIKTIDSKDILTQTASDADQYCIFKITVKYNEKILHSQFQYLRHGYYVFTDKENKVSNQKEVLFNALNIFQFISLSRKTIAQLYKEQNIDFTKLNKYEQSIEDKQVFVIELNFGNFYNVLLQENDERLNEYQRKVRQNYILSMYKIKRYDQFDFGDAYQLQKQFVKCKNYLQSKVETSIIQTNGRDSQSDIFWMSKIDNKNYFLRLSNVYNKLGMVQKAIKYIKLSIKCIEHIENLAHQQLYKKHYQKLFKMQSILIQIYQYSQDYLHVQKVLNQRQKQLKNQSNQILFRKLRIEQNTILQGANYFSMGKLRQCLIKFQNCAKSLKQEFNKLNREVIIQKGETSFSAWLYNFLCHKKYHRTCNYCEFQSIVRRFQQQQQETIRRQLQQQIKLQYGGEKQLQKAQTMVTQLIQQALQALQDQRKVLKDQNEYSRLILRYNNQLQSSLRLQDNSGIVLTKQQKMENQIKDIIKKLKKLQVNTQEYNDLKNIFIQKFQDYKRKKIGHNFMSASISQEIEIYIQEFLKKEKEKKLQNLQRSFKSFFQQNINFEYQMFLRQLQTAIEDLKAEGFAQCSLKVMEDRVKIALLAFNNQDYEKTQNQIMMILQNQNMQVSYRNIQLAEAYKLKGKLQFKKSEYLNSISDFQKSLYFYKIPKQDNSNQQQEIIPQDQGNNNIMHQLSSSIIRINHQSNKSQTHLQIIKTNNDYIEAQLLKCKSQLFYINILQKNQEYLSQIQTTRHRKQISSQLNNFDVNQSFGRIESIMSELQDIINKKNSLENVAELKVLQAEVWAYLYLNKRRYNKCQKLFKQKIQQSIELNKHLYGEGNFQNALLCCQVIVNYHDQQHLIELVGDDFLKIIEKAFENCQGKYFYWKVTLAYYYVYKNKHSLQRSFLQQTIGLLSGNAKDNYLKQQLRKIKAEYQSRFNPQDLKQYKKQKNLLNQQNYQQNIIQQKIYQHSQMINPSNANKNPKIKKQTVYKKQQQQQQNNIKNDKVLQQFNSIVFDYSKKNEQNYNTIDINTKYRQKQQQKQQQVQQNVQFFNVETKPVIEQQPYQLQYNKHENMASKQPSETSVTSNNKLSSATSIHKILPGSSNHTNSSAPSIHKLQSATSNIKNNKMSQIIEQQSKQQDCQFNQVIISQLNLRENSLIQSQQANKLKDRQQRKKSLRDRIKKKRPQIETQKMMVEDKVDKEEGGYKLQQR